MRVDRSDDADNWVTSSFADGVSNVASASINCLRRCSGANVSAEVIVGSNSDIRVIAAALETMAARAVFANNASA